MSNYNYRLPTEVYWHNQAGQERSQYFKDEAEAKAYIELAIKHNKEMGYTMPIPNYQIRARVPIKRAGSGRKRKE